MKESIWKRLAHDSAIYGGADFSTKIIGFLFFPIIARYISVAEFGAMELIFTVVGLLGILVNLGLNNSVQRFYWDKDTDPVQRPAMVTSALAMQVVAGIFVASFASVLIVIFGSQVGWAGLPFDSTVLFYAVIFMAASQWVQYVLDVIRLHFKPWRFFLLSFLFRVFGLLLAAWMVIGHGARLDGIIGSQALVTLIAFPIAIMLISKDIIRSVNYQWIIDLLKYGYPYIYAAFAYWIFGAIDRWMLASMSSVEEVGIYSVAFRFSSIVLFVSMAFGQAWSPVAMKIRSENPDRYKSIYAAILLFLFFGVALVGGGISIYSGEIVGLFLSMEYQRSALVLIPLCLGVVLQATQQVTAIGISIEKKTHLVAKISWCAVFINIAMNYVLIPHYGALGAAWATSFTYLFMTATYLVCTQMLHPLEISWARLLLLVGLVLTLFLVSIVYCQTTFEWLVVLIKLCALIVFCILGYFVLPIKKVFL